MTSTTDLKIKKREFLNKSLISQIFLSLVIPSSSFLCWRFLPQIFRRTHHLRSEMAGVEGKEKRSRHRTRTTMDFDSMLKILSSQKGVDEYLVRYGVWLPSNVKVEWCPSNTDYTETPKTGGVYLHPPSVSLGVEVPFDRLCPRPSASLPYGTLSISGRGLRVVLSFQVLYNMFLPDACNIEDFSALYMIRRTKEGGCFFGIRSGFNRLIVNLADSDHKWRDHIIHICNPLIPGIRITVSVRDTTYKVDLTFLIVRLSRFQF